MGKILVGIEESGVYETLLSELHLEVEEDYTDYLTITPGCLDELFEILKGVITKKEYKYARCSATQIEACCCATASIYWRILPDVTIPIQIYESTIS